ncbi:MAG: hypothetical protein EOP48_00510 [Sphingobacteriales bacterium]|nr:MAG: hypothetical protein EOP48_00510 [Sphingobacteriales bacterium]
MNTAGTTETKNNGTERAGSLELRRSIIRSAYEAWDKKDKDRYRKAKSRYLEKSDAKDLDEAENYAYAQVVGNLPTILANNDLIDESNKTVAGEKINLKIVKSTDQSVSTQTEEIEMIAKQPETLTHEIQSNPLEARLTGLNKMLNTLDRNRFRLLETIFYLSILPITFNGLVDFLASSGVFEGFSNSKLLVAVFVGVLDLVAIQSFKEFCARIVEKDEAVCDIKLKYWASLIVSALIISLNFYVTFHVYQSKVSKHFDTNSAPTQEYTQEFKDKQISTAALNAEYLAAKWPNESDRLACEDEPQNCSQPYIKQSEKKKIALDQSKIELEMIRKNQAIVSESKGNIQVDKGREEIKVKLVFFAALWILILFCSLRSLGSSRI